LDLGAPSKSASRTWMPLGSAATSLVKESRYVPDIPHSLSVLLAGALARFDILLACGPVLFACGPARSVSGKVARPKAPLDTQSHVEFAKGGLG
jgi:hypothetical protein